MPYKGQPVPSTVHHAYRAKISDGKSVNVSVPEKTTIENGKFYELGGFFGSAMQSVATGEGETAEVILNIEQAEFETDQIKTTDAFKVGEIIYFDKGKFTTTGAENIRKVGRVTSAKDRNNVILFVLGPQV